MRFLCDDGVSRNIKTNNYKCNEVGACQVSYQNNCKAFGHLKYWMASIRGGIPPAKQQTPGPLRNYKHHFLLKVSNTRATVISNLFSKSVLLEIVLWVSYLSFPKSASLPCSMSLDLLYEP